LQINDEGRIKEIGSSLFLPKGVNNCALGADVSEVTTAVALLTAMDSRTNRDRSCSRLVNREAVNVRRAVVFVAGFVGRARVVGLLPMSMGSGVASMAERVTCPSNLHIA